MNEEWRTVARDPRYSVSNLGRVRGPRGRVLIPQPHKDGYPMVGLGRGHTTCVHALVAEAFIGLCPEGQEVRHLNGNPTDNRVENLLYGTRHENIMDAVRAGTWMSSGRAKHVKTLVSKYRWHRDTDQETK